MPWIHTRLRAEAFSGPSIEPEVRVAGLYLLARLGEESAIAPIIALLKEGQRPEQQESLLLSLAEVTSPDEFRSHTGEAGFDHPSRGYTAADHVSMFRHAGGTAKIAAAEGLLQSDVMFYRREAVRYLLEYDQADILGKYLSPDPLFSPLFEMAAVYSPSPVSVFILVEARRMGLRIERTPDGIRFRKAEPTL